MKKLWTVLNAPLSVTLIAALFLFLLIRVGSCAADSLFDEDRKAQINALGRLQLVSFTRVRPSGVELGDRSQDEFVGAVRNNGRVIVHDIQATICFYHVDGRLLRVATGRLAGVGLLGPGEAREFRVNPTGRNTSFPETLESSEGDPPRVKATLVFVDLEVSETE